MEKEYDKHARKEAEKIAKHHGTTVNQLIKEDAAKIHHGKKTGRKLYSFDDRNISNKDRRKYNERLSAGKGDAPRNCFSEEYRNNYDEIFRKNKKDKKRSGKTIKKYK
jgi:hypothetical protein